MYIEMVIEHLKETEKQINIENSQHLGDRKWKKKNRKKRLDNINVQH